MICFYSVMQFHVTTVHNYVLIFKCAKFVIMTVNASTVCYVVTYTGKCLARKSSRSKTKSIKERTKTLLTYIMVFGIDNFFGFRF